MSDMPDTATPEPSRARRLRDATHAQHEVLDTGIMAHGSFQSLEGYGRFLRMQDAFHHDIAALYADPALRTIVPDLAQRARGELTRADLTDLELAPLERGDPLFSPARPTDRATALGWLYVSEGSNLGAALLRKEVQKLGLSDTFGARHLAPAADGPAPHWRRFVAALDAVALDEAEEARAIEAARTAFAHVQALADACLD